jgi:hypothetical protein
MSIHGLKSSVDDILCTSAAFTALKTAELNDAVVISHESPCTHQRRRAWRGQQLTRPKRKAPFVSAGL